MDDKPIIYEHAIEVTEAHIDRLGHVNNVVYVQWVQDAASAHWNSAASEAHKSSLAWVVLRHEIDYSKSAYAGDKLIARTWVGEDKGVRYERYVEIVRPADGAVIARARSQWCTVDPVTFRPKRCDRAVRANFVEQLTPA